MTGETLFSGKAAAYAASRPAYAAGALDRIRTLAPPGAAADIGAGTGIFTRQLADRGYRVYGVEPNDDMRAACAEALTGYGAVTLLPGREAATGLADRSVDLVTAAQAFHWFDGPAFLRECRRILRGDGWVFLLWNDLDAAGELRARWAEANRRFCPGFTGFSAGKRSDDRPMDEFYPHGYEKTRYPNPLSWTLADFLARCDSSSYALRPGDAAYSLWHGELAAAFRDLSENGLAEIRQFTTLYAGKVL